MSMVAWQQGKRKRESVREKETEVVIEEKIVVLLPRGEEKSEDGLIAVHRLHLIHG